MIRMIIIGAVAYIIWVLLYLCRKRIGGLFELSQSVQDKKEMKSQSFEDGDEEIMGKSLFILSQPQPHAATVLETEKVIEKEDTFVPSNDLKATGVVPNEQLDETFSDTPQPMDLDMAMEYEEEKEIDFDEEAEELQELMGRGDADLAGGFSYDEMKSAAKTIENKGATSEAEIKAGEVLHKIEATEMHQQIILGDTERAARVASLIDLHLEQYNKKVTENEDSDSSDDGNGNYGLFDIANYIKSNNLKTKKA